MNTTQVRKRVFLSYSNKDQELARDIARRLRAAGLEPITLADWPATASPLRESVAGAIRSADAVLFLVTPSALASGNVMFEIGLADGLDRVIVPVVASLGDLPLSPVLQAYQAVPYDQLDSAIAELTHRLAAPRSGRRPEEAPPRPGVPRSNRKRQQDSQERPRGES